MMNNTINAQVQGVFKLSKGNLNTNEEQHLTTFNNLILNNGLNLLFTTTTPSAFNSCSIGVGTAEPAVTDTSLTNHRFSVNGNHITQGNTSGIYRWSTFKYRFNPNVAGTYTEIGIGTASNNLFSKSLIKDSNGDPIAITLLSDEYLDVTYEIRFYINTTETTITNFNLGKSIHTLNTKAAYINSTEAMYATATAIHSFYGSNFQLFSGPVAASNTGGPSGSSSNSTSITSLPYVSNSFERSHRAIFDLNNQVNNWPIKSAFLNCGLFGLFQTEFIPDIIKTSSEILTIDFKISLGRYTGAN